ncbi:MAG: response regulator [Bacteroidota bacterium]|nr:response regulator [Bacteroidota bacterium]
MQSQLSDFVDMFDIQNTLKTNKVKEDLLIAHHVFHETYKGEIKESTNEKIAIRAVNQISLDSFDIEVPRWEKNGIQIQFDKIIVDRIKLLGPKTATIFQKTEYGYLRISTNIKNPDGSRATGSFIPNGTPMINAIEKGESHEGRESLANDWYIANYEPIYINGKVAGMLSVAEKEKDLTLIKEKFDKKRMLKTGHPFIISNNKEYKGLLVVDAYSLGDNWYETKDLKKRAYFDNMIKAYNSKSTLLDVDMGTDNKVYSFETSSPTSDRRLMVFIQYYELYEYFIGIVIPKTDFITNQLIRLFFVIISVLILFMLISIFVINRFIKSKTRPLSQSVDSIKQMTKGELPEALQVSGRDEISEIGNSLNKLSGIFRTNALFAHDIGHGKFDEEYHVLGKNDVLGNALVTMRQNLKDLSCKQEKIHWLQESTNKVNLFLREEKEITDLANQLLSHLAEIMEFQVAAIYINMNENYKLRGSYAFNVRKSNANEFAPGEGLVGQAALEHKTILFKNAPKEFIYIQSGLGEIESANVIVVPLIYQDKVVAVLELGSSHEISEEKLELLEKISESIAIAIHSINVRKEMKGLLEESIEQQKKAEKAAAELAASEEEIKQSNEMLESQTKSLKESESNLQAQQEELRVINEELLEKGRSLEIQKKETENKNKELEVSGKELEQKAIELEAASKYKSEFLANMSHELRTPLNSMLILSDDLAKNKSKKLDADQVESAEIIFKSGHDLLNLINDILDLSKIESGKMQMVFEQMPLSEIEQKITMNFSRISESKNIYLKTNYHEGLPASIESDVQRSYQIIKNLVSNAVKFTSKGGVTIDIKKPDATNLPEGSKMKPGNTVAIIVSDTGIGIAENKQKAIFDAFKQVDGGTSRKYGGTGLGLSISRELTKLLGGELHLVSKEGEGSSFSLLLPLSKPQGNIQADLKKENKPSEKTKTVSKTDEYKAKSKLNKTIDDDREEIKKGIKTILVVEDDTTFLNNLLKLCHEKGFNFLASTTGAEGLIIANKFQPDAIILDIRLPDFNGWDLLKKLKENSTTRHIPVHMMSAEEQSIDPVKRGAIGFITKSAESETTLDMLNKIEDYIDASVMNLLIVEDDNNLRTSIRKLISKEKNSTLDASTGEEALKILSNTKIDCMILDLGLPDMSGFELLEIANKDKSLKLPPIVVYTGKDLTSAENELLHQYTNSIIIKGEKSVERLLDETALFLHKVVNDSLKEIPSTNVEEYDSDIVFKDKSILLVDDDMRNVFALSKILRDNGMRILKAANGNMALEKLKKHPEIDFVLLDIMMPEMDGYETLKEIRKKVAYKNLPIIAITAKAMKGDKEKCLEAGANDYLTKPVDVDKLLSIMRVWLYK